MRATASRYSLLLADCVHAAFDVNAQFKFDSDSQTTHCTTLPLAGPLESMLFGGLFVGFSRALTRVVGAPLPRRTPLALIATTRTRVLQRRSSERSPLSPLSLANRSWALLGRAHGPQFSFVSRRRNLRSHHRHRHHRHRASSPQHSPAVDGQLLHSTERRVRGACNGREARPRRRSESAHARQDGDR